MTLSFIVTVYNVEEYLPQCIESLLAQNIIDFEVILVNDGSPDGCGNICNQYSTMDKRVQVIYQKNQGVSVARNNGMKAAKGDWICFIDGDDAISNNFIDIFNEYLRDDYDICFMKHREVENKDFMNLTSYKLETKPVFMKRNDFEQFEYAIFNRDRKNSYDFHLIKPATPCKLYRREFILRYGISFPVGIPTGEDSIFNLYCFRYAKQGVFLDVPVYFHRVWGGSVSKKYNDHAEEDFKLLHAIYKEYIKSDINPERFIRAYNERCTWSFGFCCILDYCHPDNKNPYNIRKRKFLTALQGELGESINKVDLSNFRLPKAVLFLLIKKKNFRLVSLLCYLNERKGT